MRHWPTRTDALRVMDDGGRTLLDWTVPAATAQPVTYAPTSVPTKPAGNVPRPAPPMMAEALRREPINARLGQPLFAVGQAISYAEDGQPETWNGGYEIVRLDDPRREPQFAIRSADSRTIGSSMKTLREDLGAGARTADLRDSASPVCITGWSRTCTKAAEDNNGKPKPLS